MKQWRSLRWILGTLLLVAVVAIGVFWYHSLLYPFRNISAGDLSLNGTTIVVEVANDPVLRAKGLGGRDSLDPKAGMLFVFNKPGKYEFWMKDMKFPLDIIWFDKDWNIVDVTKDLKPETYPKTVQPKKDATYVLEVNAGFVDKYSAFPGNKASFEAH